MVEIKIYFLFYFVVVWGGDRERAEWAKCVEYQHEDMCWIAYTLLKAEHSSSDLQFQHWGADTGRSQRPAEHPG